MKRIKGMIQPRSFCLASVLVFGLLIGGVNPSLAVPVQGTVDPGSDWASTLGGTATYSFSNVVGGSNASMTALVLAFEGDVFNLGSTGIIASSLSSGWNVATLGLGTYEFSLLGGTPIAAGSALTFSANYALLGSALSVNSWDQGAYWSQTFGVFYSGSPYFETGATVYSGAAPVATPEPGSLLLFSLALGTIAFWKGTERRLPNE
jgi:hypothetical protein